MVASALRSLLLWLPLLMAGCTSPAPVEAGAAPTANATRPSLPASADRRARLAQWQRLGYGMFVHWGLYSELGGVWNGQPVTNGYSEQIQGWARIPTADYAKVAARFAAPKFDADAICGLAKDAGARYIVVTSKHHDGFVMFDTKSTDFNIVKRTPFAKDPLKLLSAACRKQGLGFGVYFSLVDWHAGHTPEVEHNSNPIPAAMEPLIEQQLRELMSNYGPITEVWFDMSAPTPAQSRRFAAIVRELQPQAAINGRIWNNQGDFVTLGDNESPPPTMQPPFQVPASVYHETWGYRSWQKREDATGKTRELVRGLVDARAAGGNYLLNIGPKGDGSVVPFEGEVLGSIGAWLQRHPRALLDAQPSGLPPQPWGATSRNGDAVYLFVHAWRDEIVLDGIASDPRRIVIDHATQAQPALPWRREGSTLRITLPAQAQSDPVLPVLRVEFDAPPRIVPAWIVTTDANDHIQIARAQWHPGTSFGFGSGYRSQYPTTVQLSTSVAAQHAQAVMLRLQGVKANDDRRYRITLGDSSIEANAMQLRSAALGPFPLPAASAVLLTIRLADPAWPAQDLGLDFSGAKLQPLQDDASR